MNNVGGALNFNATLDLNEWKRNVEQIRRDLLGLSDTTVKETQSMDSAFRNLSIGVASYLSINSLKSFVTELINVRGEFQKTEIAFTTMLGNADQARDLMGQMVDLAAKTPFGLQDVSAGAKQLLAFQVPANEVVDVLTRMGNIAAGLGVPLSRINLAYGQVKAKGKLAGDDLRQFTEAGIPMVAELAKKFNKTTSEITEMVSAGKIGFKDVQDVLFSMTNEGGMFFNLMEKQSASLSGRIANLGDTWDQMLNKIGEGNEGLLNSGIEGLTYLVENYQKVLNIIEGLIVAYGSYKAAVIVTSAAQSFGNRTIQSEIALLSTSEKMKLRRAMVTQRQAEATLAEAQSERAALQIKYATLQAEASSLAVKKQKAIALAMEKAQALGNAQVQLALANAELRAVTANGTAREVLVATKNVEKAQNIVLAAQEEASITRKGALTIASQVQTNQIELKTVATGLSAAANTVETATETVQTAAKTANAIATTRLTIATTLRTAATRLAITAQALLNATMLNNPIVLLIAGAVALTYAYLKLRDTSTAASIAEKQLNDERQRSSKLIEELKNKTQELTSVINSDTSTKLQQLEAYKQMQKMYPSLLSSMDLETFKKLGSTEAQKKLNAELDKFSTQNIRSNIEKSQKSIEEYSAKIEELNKILKKRNGDSGIYLEQLEIAKKNLEAQKINLEKYNNELDQRLENERLSTMSLAEQKKYWEGQVKSITQEISALEKSNVKKAEALDKVNNIHSLVKSTSIGLINWNINPLLSQLTRAQTEINKINNAQNGASIDKNKAYWEAQKKAASEANDAMSGKQIGSAAWNENVRKYREADDALKKYDYSDKELLKAQKAREKERLKLEKGAEKSYLQGSLSRIEQEISLREEALKRSSGNSVQMRYIDKYGKERFSNEVKSVKSIQDELLALREKRAEREKLIEVKSFQESLDETKRQIDVRDKLLQLGYSKETTDSMFPEVKDKSFLQYLNEIIASLEKTSGNEAAENLTKIHKLLSEYQGSATFIENVNKQIDQLKAKFEGNDLIQKLEEFRKANLKGTTGEEKNSKNIAINKAQEEELKKQQDFYNSFVKDKETFEQRKLAIESRYNELRKRILESNFSDAEKARQTEEANKAQAKEISAMSWELFQKTDAYVKAFGDLEKIGPRTLKKIRDQFKAFLDSDAGKALNPQDLKLYNDALKNLDAQISKNPFNSIGIAIDKYKKKREELNKIERESGKSNSKYKEKLEETNFALLEVFDSSSNAVSGVVGFASSLGNALGMLSDDSNQALKDVEQLVDGVSNAVQGYFSGNYAQMAGGIVQMVTSISSLVGGDNAREKQIKEWERAINNLKNTYTDLQRAIEKTAGEASLTQQRDLISNLKEQQNTLSQMRDKELEKKKVDKDKVDSFTNQINDINRQVEDLVTKFKESVTTVEFKDLAQKMAEALTSAFSSGEDAAKSFDKVVDDVMRNAVQNALKMKFLDSAAQNMVDALYQSMGYGKSNNKDIEKAIKQAQIELDKVQERINTTGNFQEAKALEHEKYLLQQKINNLKQQIANSEIDGSFDGLTTEERDKIKAMGEDAMKKYMEALKQYQDLFGQSAENAQGLKGDIKGITEKTAGALEGQINAMRIMQAEALKIQRNGFDVMRSQLLVQTQIEQNTRPLKGIYDEIRDLNSKVKKSLAGIP
ncbi:tape measure protein [Chryseobacterium bernardetii]|uniref:tape measure protein n=1 Tax=Chryseobacterium bernardetii TaxID=1241978 RepID=UPI0016254184|nr:tape measure protein [Chryseobacterium bernardetii]